MQIEFFYRDRNLEDFLDLVLCPDLILGCTL